MTIGSHLLGVPKGGPLQPTHILGGARGPLVFIFTTSEMRISLGRGGAQTETWADVEVEIVDETGRQQASLEALQMMQLRIKRPRSGD